HPEAAESAVSCQFLTFRLLKLGLDILGETARRRLVRRHLRPPFSPDGLPIPCFFVLASRVASYPRERDPAPECRNSGATPSSECRRHAAAGNDRRGAGRSNSVCPTTPARRPPYRRP